MPNPPANTTQGKLRDRIEPKHFEQESLYQPMRPYKRLPDTKEHR